MSDGLVSGVIGFVIGLFVMAIIGFAGCVSEVEDETRELREKWQRETIQRGFAEYYRRQDDTVEFRWKPVDEDAHAR